MPNSPEPTPKIFISYAWKNQTIAKRLQSDLQRGGVEVFVDYEKITGGDSLPERISAALEWCNTLVLLWSADSAQSYYVSQEWTSAFHLQKRIIACVLDGTPLPALLAGRLYLNFTPYENGYSQLCRSLGVVLKPSIEKTAPPEPPKHKLPPQHVEMPVPQPPNEKRESPPPAPPKRKSFAETLRRKPKPPDPAPVLKPPEIFDDAKDDDTNTGKMATPARWSHRKALVALLVVAAISLAVKMVCYDSTNPISTPTKPEQASPSQTVRRFRDKPTTLSYAQVKNMLQHNDFFCKEYSFNKEFSNPLGRGFANQFEKQQNGQVIRDRASGLTWQRAGSDNYIRYADAEKYVRDLNAENFAGFSDWRLPTLEEAMSLMEPKNNPASLLYIDSWFYSEQTWIWTSDTHSAGVAWVTIFSSGHCDHSRVSSLHYVRVVR